MAIQILDAATVGKIAAGEVVERPASIVKELIENSIDAGATAITIEARAGGIDYLRVTDNGGGIAPNEVRMAFENHATSKIKNADELTRITTLGFRGEALPSIAAVSKVEMTTRQRGAESGVCINIEGGRVLSVRESGCPEGTTLIMRDLFFNLPVRRVFLKKASYELGILSDFVARMILGNPNVAIRLISGGKTIYHSFGDGDLRHAVLAVYGRETAQSMVEVDSSEGGLSIAGLIGVGDAARPTRAHEAFFVNGRSIRCPMLSQALESVTRTRVTIGMYPMCALAIRMPATSVDVNVHPNKLEVRFRDEPSMRIGVEAILNKAFAGEKLLDIEKAQGEKPVVQRENVVRQTIAPERLPESSKPTEVSFRPNATPVLFDESRPRSNSSLRVAEGTHETAPTGLDHAALRDAAMMRTASIADGTTTPTDRIITPTNGTAPAADGGIAPPADAPAAGTGQFVRREPGTVVEPIKMDLPGTNASDFRVIGTLFKTYILIETAEALLMIDQHAAHERINFENYKRYIDEGRASQQLLVPIVVHVSAREMQILTDNEDILLEAGYEVEPFGEKDVKINALPHIMGKTDNIAPLFSEMLGSLDQLRNAETEKRLREIMQMACKHAVKGGDALTDAEVTALIATMQKTGASPTCPHGRPVMRVLRRREIEVMFKRIQ